MFIKQSTYYVPASILYAGDIEMNKMNKNCCFQKGSSIGEENQ